MVMVAFNPVDSVDAFVVTPGVVGGIVLLVMVVYNPVDIVDAFFVIVGMVGGIVLLVMVASFLILFDRSGRALIFSNLFV